MKKKFLSLALTLAMLLSLTVPSALAKVYVEDVELDQNKVTMEVGETLYLEATISPDDATNQSVTWESDDTSVATVNRYGKVTAVDEGVTYITVETDDGGYTDRCKVTVEDDDDDDYVTGVTITSNGSGSLLVGSSRTLEATVSYKYGDDDDEVKWSTSNDSVATDSSRGVVKGVGEGRATITATSKVENRDGDYETDIYIVTVSEPESATISVGSSLVKAGKQVILPVSIQNNSGIAGYALSLSIPEPLTLTAVTMGQLPTDAELGTLTWNEENNYILWTSGENLYGDGELLLLTLQAPETCSPGMYTIGLSTPEGQTIPFSDDADNALTVSLTAGTLEVCDYTLGDIDNDGDLTAADAVAQALHIVEKRILTGSALLAADLDRDGVVTVKDAVKLLQWLDKGVEP